MNLSRSLPLVLTLAASALLPLPALAQLVADPYVDEHVEHDSNVFRAPNSQANILAFGDPTLADSDVRSVAGINGSYLAGDQKLTFQAEGRRFDYEHFTTLDHNEYLLDTALKWKLTSLLDGSIEARQESAMAPFGLGNSPYLTIDVDSKATAKINLNVNTDWRLEGSVYDHVLKAPLEFYPNYSYPNFVDREIGSHIGILNTGHSNLTFGFGLDRIDGTFENAPGAGPYTQNTAALTGSYIVSGLTTLNAAVGYTVRAQPADEGNVAAMTGSIGFSRQLTGKTSVNVQLVRAVNSYIAAAGAEIDTSVTAGVVWQATYKINLAINGGYMRSAFIGQAITGSSANSRVDTIPTESMDINYQVFRRVKLHAYVNKQARTSDVYLFNFSDTIYGIEAKFTWR